MDATYEVQTDVKWLISQFHESGKYDEKTIASIEAKINFHRMVKTSSYSLGVFSEMRRAVQDEQNARAYIAILPRDIARKHHSIFEDITQYLFLMFFH